MGVIYPQVGLWEDGANHNLVFNFFGDHSRPEMEFEDSAVQFERIRVLEAQDARDLLTRSEMLAERDLKPLQPSCSRIWGSGGRLKFASSAVSISTACLHIITSR